MKKSDYYYCPDCGKKRMIISEVSIFFVYLICLACGFELRKTTSQSLEDLTYAK